MSLIFNSHTEPKSECNRPHCRIDIVHNAALNASMSSNNFLTCKSHSKVFLGTILHSSFVLHIHPLGILTLQTPHLRHSRPQSPRSFWSAPGIETQSRTSGFCAQSQKFETITVTIGYKSRQLLRLCVALAKRIAALGMRMDSNMQV